MMRKKAAIKTLQLVVWALVLVIVLITILLFTAASIKRESDIRDSEVRAFTNLLLYSKDGISYVDEDLGRVVVSTVDLAKIDSEYLDNIKTYGENQVLAVKLTVETKEGYLLKEDIYNERWYIRWEPLVGKRGRGASSEIIEIRYVIVYDKGKPQGPAILKMRILIPNA